MKYRLRHTTLYNYQQIVNFGHNRGVLKPRDTYEQHLVEFTIKITPEPSEINEFVDYFGNNATHFLIPYQHSKLIVEAVGVVEKKAKEVRTSSVTMKEYSSMLKSSDATSLDVVEFQLESPYIPLADEKIEQYARQFFGDEKNVLKASLELNHQIFSDFRFVPGATTVSTPISEVFEKRQGVCQDFAHFAIACFRSVGIPARYVSGYIETLPPEGEVKLQGVDATHAWVAIFLPDIGWIDIDPTNDCLANMQHIVTGWGRDYGDVAPLKGVVYSSGLSQLNVSVDIERIAE